MVFEDKSFSTEEAEILSSMHGKTLICIDGVIVAREDTSWNAVRLHLSGIDIDLINTLGEITIDEFGTLEEFGLLKVQEGSRETLEVPEASPDTTVFSINATVQDVQVLVDCIDVIGDGVKVATIKYPQAVIIETSQGYIVLDKEVWFSETIAIKQGDDVGALLYDDSQNWEDDPEEDPSTHYDFSTEIVAV